MEYNEHFNPGGTYNASISDRAINGGVVPAGTGDPVSVGTAYSIRSLLREVSMATSAVIVKRTQENYNSLSGGWKMKTL